MIITVLQSKVAFTARKGGGEGEEREPDYRRGHSDCFATFQGFCRPSADAEAAAAYEYDAESFRRNEEGIASWSTI